MAALEASIARAGPLTGPILNDGTTAVVEDFQPVPASSASRPLARINVLREVPAGTRRLFVNDLNGPFYVIDAGVVTMYMDFAAIFSDLKIAPGLASGFVSFAFAPDFATSGRFYTVHSEEVGSKPANLGPAQPTDIVQHSILV